jgi:hypothetical protein
MTQPENPVLLEAFEWLAPMLMEFAGKHSLSVDRYKRGFPVWEFYCRHPRGGAASLQLALAESRDTGEIGAIVQPHWWIDFENEQRRMASTFPPVRLDSLHDIREVLEREFAMMLASEQSVLTRESRLADPALTALRGRDFGAPEIGKLQLPT